jgi:hypothetical protein
MQSDKQRNPRSWELINFDFSEFGKQLRWFEARAILSHLGSVVTVTVLDHDNFRVTEHELDESESSLFLQLIFDILELRDQG